MEKKSQLQSKLKKLVSSVKSTLIPTSKDERSKRFGQYRDFVLFTTSIVLFMKYEDKIRKLVSIDTAELNKVAGAQNALPRAY